MANEVEVGRYVFSKLRETLRLAENYTQIDNKFLSKRNAYIRLKKFLDDFIAGGINNRLIILPGLRGTGKTTILFQLYEYLLKQKNIKPENVLYVSADDIQSIIGGNIANVILTYVKDVHQTSLIELKEKVFIFIDEAHFDRGWSQIVKVVYDSTKNVFIIVTGSSALSLEMSTDTARRSKKESLFPLNFQEYLLLKHNFYPPAGTAEAIRKSIFSGHKTDVDTLVRIENQLNKNMLHLPASPEIELRNYIYYGGFPFGIMVNRWEVYEKTADIIDRIILKDLPIIRSFDTQTYHVISKIVSFIALQKPGGTSQDRLSKHLQVSSSLVKEILDSLEKTQILFSLKPYGGAGKTIRKAWKYYFSSSTINSTLMWKLGRLDIASNEIWGILVENAVASYFFRMSKMIKKPTKPMGLFFDPNKGGVDFLFLDNQGNIIPVEVGGGKKDTRQIKTSIGRFKSDYGVVISPEEKTRREDNIIFVPLKTFLFS